MYLVIVMALFTIALTCITCVIATKCALYWSFYCFDITPYHVAGCSMRCRLVVLSLSLPHRHDALCHQHQVGGFSVLVSYMSVVVNTKPTCSIVVLLFLC